MAKVKVELSVTGANTVKEAFRSVETAAGKSASAIRQLVAMNNRDRLNDLKKFQQDAAKVNQLGFDNLQRFLKDEVRATREASAEKLRIEKAAAQESINIQRRIDSDLKRFRSRGAFTMGRPNPRMAPPIIETIGDIERAEIALLRGKVNRKFADKFAPPNVSDFVVGAGGGGGGRTGGGAPPSFASQVAGSAGTSFARSLGHSLSRTVGMAGTALSLAGGFEIASATHQEIGNRGIAKSFELQSEGAVSADSARRRAAQVGTMYGVSTEEVLKSLQMFSEKSGRYKEGMESLQEIVELGRATGADLIDVARSVGSLVGSTGSTKTALSLMRVVSEQGRFGAVDVKELAPYAGRIGAAASMFANKDASMVQLAAMAQQAGTTGGMAGTRRGAAQVTQALINFSQDIMKHPGNFAGMGAFNKDHLLNNPFSIVRNIVASTGGDPTKLNRFKFTAPSMHLIQPYQEMFTREMAAQRGMGVTGKSAQLSGMAKVDAAIDVLEKQILSEATVREEAKRRTGEIDAQIESLHNEFRTVVGEAIIPGLRKLLPGLRELIPLMGKGVGAVVDNPIPTGAALIGGKAVLDAGTNAVGTAIGLKLATGALAGAGAAAGIGALLGLPLAGFIVNQGFAAKDEQRRIAMGPMADIEEARFLTRSGNFTGREAAGSNYIDIIQRSINDQTREALNHPFSGGSQEFLEQLPEMNKALEAIRSEMQDMNAKPFWEKFGNAWKVPDKLEVAAVDLTWNMVGGKTPWTPSGTGMRDDESGISPLGTRE